MTAAAARQQTDGDVWARLAAPLDPARIKQREGSQGKMLRYIDAQYVAEILDREAGPGNWSLDMNPLVQQDPKGNVSVVATLTINGVTRQGIGSGRDYKAAETDSFKRAAVRFGIGKELYEERASSQPAPSKVTGTSSAPSSPRKSSGPAADRLMPFGKTKGKRLGDLPILELTNTRGWCADTNSEKFADLIAAIDEVLAQKRTTEEYPAALEQEDDDLPF